MKNKNIDHYGIEHFVCLFWHVPWKKKMVKGDANSLSESIWNAKKRKEKIFFIIAIRDDRNPILEFSINDWPNHFSLFYKKKKYETCFFWVAGPMKKKNQIQNRLFCYRIKWKKCEWTSCSKNNGFLIVCVCVFV